MKYLCLCYADEEAFGRMPERELDALLSDQVACDASLRQSGHMLSSESLESVRIATTLRVRNGKLSVTDGPFAETKEQLGGFHLIEAVDLNEAIRIASQFPSARYGSIEIRPVFDIRQYVAERRR
jgi:hypothetical protein